LFTSVGKKPPVFAKKGKARGLPARSGGWSEGKAKKKQRREISGNEGILPWN